ncbi:hypothetical protein ACIBCS_22080 [Streptomyces phaeochromogenes]|uniref:hypothetical protein n=1 Tax=Streptomyces phaeochromogenes TaxID=1923 RepID=UPI0033ED5B54
MALDDCARETRGLAAVVADPDASYDARLTAACGHVEAAVEALVGAMPERAVTASVGVLGRHSMAPVDHRRERLNPLRRHDSWTHCP